MSLHRLCFALLCGLCILALRVTPLHAQTPPIQLWYITFNSQADLQTLARELDVWEVNHATRQVLAPLDPATAAAMQATHTVELALDQSPLAPPQLAASQVNGIPGFACYRTVDETYATLDQLALNYPQLVKAVKIGDSWDKANTGGPAGDDLRVLVITNQATAGPKFRFLLMGAIHAREYTTAELALRFAEQLLQNYGRDANATWLLDHGELHLLTVANPDGRRIAETGQLWRKNTHADDSCTVSLPFRSYGVDLNRNSTFQWNNCETFNCSSGSSCSETYRGESPASEPEVAAVEAYMRSIFPDARAELLTDRAPDTTAGLFITLHSYGRLVLFPWGWTTTEAPNAHGLATIARRLGYSLDYTVCQAGGAGCLYQTDGTTDDYAYGDLGVASFTIELGTAFFQSCPYFEETIVPAGLEAIRYAFLAAPQPYRLAQGPEVINPTIAPKTVSAEISTTHIAVTATADASRMAFLSGNGVDDITEPTERIRAARLTVDALPWADNPLTYAFTPLDGTFNTVQETITANIEMACLPSGRHTLYMQAVDEGNDWGVVNAGFVTVTNASAFTMTAATSSASSQVGVPVTYTVTLTNTSATTATYTLEANGPDQVAIHPSTPVTLSGGTGLAITVVITPQNNTADNRLPTVFIARSIHDPTLCRQLHVTTTVAAWNYQQRLPIIGTK